MSRIVTESYKDLASRIYQRIDAADARVQSKNSPKGAFPTVLKDLESKEINKESSKLAVDSGSVKGSRDSDRASLSNLLPGEKLEARDRLSETLTTPKEALLPARKAIKTAYQSANLSPQSVKFTTTKPDAKQAALSSAVQSASGLETPIDLSVPPSAPKLISAKLIDSSKSASAESLPNLVHENKGVTSATNDLDAIILGAARRHGVDPNLTRALAKAESDFQISAVSSDGHFSKGLFQLLDSTGQEMLGELSLSESYAPFDPEQNSHLGIGYLRKMFDQFSTSTELTPGVRTVAAKNADHLEKLALAAYNAGSSRVARAQKRVEAAGGDPSDYNSVAPELPESTQAYVDKIGEFRTALNLISLKQMNS